MPDAEKDTGPCAPATRYACLCGGTAGCGCRLTAPPTHFHDTGRYAGPTCPLAPGSLLPDAESAACRLRGPHLPEGEAEWVCLTHGLDAVRIAGVCGTPARREEMTCPTRVLPPEVIQP